VLIVALLVGGSSVRGVTSTMVVEMLALLVLPATVAWSRSPAYWPAVTWTLCAALGVAALQLLPIGGLMPLYLVTDAGLALPRPVAWTVAMDRTVEAIFFFGAPAVMFLALGRFSEDAFNRLLPFVYLGLLANVVVALVQFAARKGAELNPGFLPYEAAAGFFANPNHFATLMFVGIPLVIYQFVAIRKPLLSLAAIAVIVLACFATGSVAGAFLSLGCALVSYALIAPLDTRWRAALIGLALSGVALLSLNVGNVLDIQPDDPLNRVTIWRNTLAGIASYLPFGSGFGTFDLVYPQFETVADVQSSFINHAHNEFLELLLEGGVATGVLLAAYLALVARAMIRLPASPLRWAALCGLGFVLLHSLVDYPLRNIAMAFLFAILNAIVFSAEVGTLRPAEPERRRRARPGMSRTRRPALPVGRSQP